MAKVTLHTFTPHPGQQSIFEWVKENDTMRNVACMVDATARPI
jgi:hypothetical protein